MDQDEARELKAQLADYLRELVEARVRPAGLDAAGGAAPLALGLSPQRDGGYELAVRYRLGLPTARMLARKVAGQVGTGVDVRRTGRIRPLRAGGPPAPRPPVVTALAVGETGRVRPLRPGVSVAHVDVSAGTLGAFVQVDGVLHALSNYHVLVGSPQNAVGDVVLQPGPADGGRAPRDRIGTLAAFAPLTPGVRGAVDAATALLDDADVDLDHPVGRITSTAAAVGGEEVAKIGRTTATTTGRVSAIELDDVVVDYGAGLGELAFDDQIEVESTGAGPFSRGGDSGSLVYRTDGVAIGLLFAGSESGGENGIGLTYVNPIDTVLTALGARLAGS